MAREKRDLEAKEQRKTIANQATAMVDGGGDWPQCKRHRYFKKPPEFVSSLRS